MSSNPNYFIVQPYDDKSALLKMMADLQIYCANNKEFLPSEIIEANETYAVLHGDGSWYRATVVTILRGSSNMVHIQYCDYGDVSVVSTDKLKILPVEFRSLPRQATKAQLHGE